MIVLTMLLLACQTQAPDEETLKAKVDSILDFIKKDRQEETLQAAVSEFLLISAQADALDAYDLSAEVLGRAGKIARALRDAERVLEIKTRASEVKSLKREWSKVKRALKTLEKKPDDSRSNLAVGLYLAPLKGDWDKGLPHLAKGSDKTLANLAQADASAGAAADVRIHMAKQWEEYARKKPEFRPRALHWYAQAWPELDGVTRKQAASRILALQAHKFMPGKEWKEVKTVAGWNFTAGSGPGFKHSRSGKTAARVVKAKDEQRGHVSMQGFEVTPGAKVKLTFYVLTVGEEKRAPHAGLWYRDKNNRIMFAESNNVAVVSDHPFWKRYEVSDTVPDDALGIRFDVNIWSEGSSLWVDDVSLKVNGREMLKNGGFEKP